MWHWVLACFDPQWPDLKSAVAYFTKILPECPTLPAMIARFRQFIADEGGATSIEYAIIASGVAAAIIAVVNNLGTTVLAKYTSVATALK
jgi:pilus assembly protein Flp/PilA